jgi:hypothetical protein
MPDTNLGFSRSGVYLGLIDREKTVIIGDNLREK